MADPGTTSAAGWCRKNMGLFTNTGLTTPVSANGDAIAGWYDQTGNGNHLLQPTAANRPLYDADRGLVQNCLGANQFFTMPAGYSVNARAASFMFICEIQGLRQGYNTALTQYKFLLGSSGLTSNIYQDGTTGKLGIYDGAFKASTATPPTSRACILVVMDSGATTIYVNGVASTTTLLANASSSGFTLLGSAASAYPAQGAYSEVAWWNRALNSTEAAQMYAYSQTLGVLSAAAYTVVWDGDSISYGLYAALNQGPVQQSLFQNARVYNVAEASKTLATLTTDAPTWVDPLKSGAGKDYLVIFAGTNDIYLAGKTGAQTYTQLVTYCTARRSAGWNKIIVVTMLPRGGTTMETYRQDYNSAIRAGFAAGTLPCDAVADVGSDPTIGQAGQQANTTYFFDAIHPTKAGDTIVASYTSPAVGLISLFRGRVLTPPRTSDRSFFE